MAIDFNKIRNRVEAMKGQGKRKSVLWKPEDNATVTVRIVPWADGNDGMPFKERTFYYNIGKNAGILAPSQFQKPDPIQELIDKLKSEGTPESYNVARQFFPKRRFFAPVIVRGQEDEGVKIWGFGKMVAQELYNIIMDDDYGDITNPETGYDVKITTSKGDGDFAKTSVMARPKSTPLSGIDPNDKTKTKKEREEGHERAKEWLTSVPNIDEIYKLLPYAEIEKKVNDHLNGTESEESNKDEEHVIPQGAKKVQSRDSGEVVSEKEFSDIGSAFDELGELVEEAS